MAKNGFVMRISRIADMGHGYQTTISSIFILNINNTDHESKTYSNEYRRGN